MLVDDREFLLIKLRETAFGSGVQCVVRCPDASCGKRMDLDFDTAEFDFESKPVGRRYFSLKFESLTGEACSAPEPIEIEFRLPTGGDQDLLADVFAADRDQAVNELMAGCIRRIGDNFNVNAETIETLPSIVRETIESNMQELSPHVEIELAAQCPECEFQFESVFDLPAFFMAELRRNLSELEREVHLLAWHYHWPEHEIMTMPRKRRRRYVSFLRSEVDRINQVW